MQRGQVSCKYAVVALFQCLVFTTVEESNSDLYPVYICSYFEKLLAEGESKSKQITHISHLIVWVSGLNSHHITAMLTSPQIYHNHEFVGHWIILTESQMHCLLMSSWPLRWSIKCYFLSSFHFSFPVLHFILWHLFFFFFLPLKR